MSNNFIANDPKSWTSKPDLPDDNLVRQPGEPEADYLLRKGMAIVAAREAAAKAAGSPWAYEDAVPHADGIEDFGCLG